MKKFDYYIGIDPGAKNGIALWVTEDQDIRWTKTIKGLGKLFDFIDEIVDMYSDSIQIRVEDARQISGRKERSFGAGNVCAICREIDDYLKSMKIHYLMVRPNQMINLDAKRFEIITGISYQTNQHERDAAMIVFGIK